MWLGRINAALSTPRELENCLLKIKELNEISLAQYLLVHSSSNSKRLQGFKVSVKDIRFRFSRPQRDGFYLPNCKLQHEFNDNICAADTFLRGPYLSSKRVVSILAKFV